MNNKLDLSTLFSDLTYEQVSDDNRVIILGDSLKVMKSLKSESVDLIFADPPYNIGKDFGNNKDKWEDVDSYVGWCKNGLMSV